MGLPRWALVLFLSTGLGFLIAGHFNEIFLVLALLGILTGFAKKGERSVNQDIEKSKKSQGGTLPKRPPFQILPSDFEDENLDFDWVEQDRLAAGQWPGESARTWLASKGIRVLINLCHRTYEDPRFEVHSILLEDGAPPEFLQIQAFLDFVEERLRAGLPVYVHCLAGCGRTGSMLACYLAKSRGLDGVEAIRQMREIRPCSIENTAQEDAVLGWCQSLGSTLRDSNP